MVFLSFLRRQKSSRCSFLDSRFRGNDETSDIFYAAFNNSQSLKFQTVH